MTLLHCKSWKKWLLAIVVIVAALGVLFWWFQIRDVPLRISPETTRITEPRTADGRIDYWRAYEDKYEPPETKTDQNGYRLLVETMLMPINKPNNKKDEEAVQKSQRYQRLYQKLDLPVDLEPKYEFKFAVQIVCDDFRAQGIEPNYGTVEEQLTRPWTLENFPMLRDWINDKEPLLSVVAEAVRKPFFIIPVVRCSDDYWIGSPVDGDEYQRFRSLGRAFLYRFHYYLGIGDIDRAIDDLVTCSLLGRVLMQQNDPSWALVGITIEGFAQEMDIAANPEHPPTRAQYERLLHELENLPTLPKADEVLAAGRFGKLDLLQLFARGANVGKYTDLVKLVLGDQSGSQGRYLGYDWNVLFQEANRYYDTLEEEKEFEPVGNPFESPWFSLKSREKRSLLAADALFCYPPEVVMILNETSQQKSLRQSFTRHEQRAEEQKNKIRQQMSELP